MVDYLQTIEKYINDSGGSNILCHFDENGSLTVNQRRKVINFAAEFMIQRYGKKISTDDKISVAKALVELFPSLEAKGKNIKPYVCLILFFSQGKFNLMSNLYVLSI